jgi:hypothetical protein
MGAPGRRDADVTSVIASDDDSGEPLIATDRA